MNNSSPDPPPVTPPLAYQSPLPFGKDLEHLKLLAWGHYLYGGLTMACSSFFILYIVIGVMALRNPAMFTPATATTGPAATAPAAPTPPPRPRRERPRPRPGPRRRCSGGCSRGWGRRRW